MQKMLAYDAAERMSAREGLQHAYFRDVRELEARSVVCARVVCGLRSVVCGSAVCVPTLGMYLREFKARSV